MRLLKNVTDIDNNKNNIGVIEQSIANMNLKIDRIQAIENNTIKNYNISQINFKKSEFNTGLIDILTSNIKNLNSTLTDIKNDIDRID